MNQKWKQNKMKQEKTSLSQEKEKGSIKINNIPWMSGVITVMRGSFNNPFNVSTVLET